MSSALEARAPSTCSRSPPPESAALDGESVSAAEAPQERGVLATLEPLDEGVRLWLRHPTIREGLIDARSCVPSLNAGRHDRPLVVGDCRSQLLGFLGRQAAGGQHLVEPLAEVAASPD